MRRTDAAGHVAYLGPAWIVCSLCVRSIRGDAWAEIVDRFATQFAARHGHLADELRSEFASLVLELEQILPRHGLPVVVDHGQAMWRLFRFDSEPLTSNDAPSANSALPAAAVHDEQGDG